MKLYSENPGYQSLLSVLEKTKNSLDTVKAEKKKVRAFFKTKKKEAESKAAVFTTYLQYKQAKLKQKIEKLAVRSAELNLAVFVHNFQETHKQEAIVAQSIEDNKKSKSKKQANSETDTLEKPEPKTSKKKVSDSKTASKTAKMQENEVIKSTKKTKKTTHIVSKDADSTSSKKELALKTKQLNDLTVIEGIGPKIAKILSENGVNNFNSLINTPIEDIKTWLKEHKLPFIDPSTWAEQAQLLIDGNTEAFEVLKKALKGGKRAQS